MFLKADWKTHIHAIRKEEVRRAFSSFLIEKFKKGIEFGSGDGYQTTLIAPKCSTFISSDLNFKRLRDDFKIADVDYRAYDADALVGLFEPNTFDLVFSSSLIEHLSDKSKFLRETREILSADGYSIHIVPARMLKISYLALFYPNLFLLIIDRLIGIFSKKPIFRGSANNFENNINLNRSNKISKWKILFLPQIHGNYKTHLEEWCSWGKIHWQKLFEDAGYQPVGCLKGPIVSGYGFGWDRLRSRLESLGCVTSYIFILKKVRPVNSIYPLCFLREEENLKNN